MKSYKRLDYFRVIAAVLVVAIHTSPLSTLNETADFILTRVIARIAVPFFFMVTGFFVMPKLLETKSKAYKPMRNFIIKTAALYLLSIVIYIPVNIYTGYFNGLSFYELLKDVVFNGTFYHLWYFPAVITGVLLLCSTSRLLSQNVAVQKPAETDLRYSEGLHPHGTPSLKTAALGAEVFKLWDKWLVYAVVLTLYVVGLFGDSYYELAKNSIISPLYELLFSVMDYTRNGLFFAPLFIYMGYHLHVKKPTGRTSYYLYAALFFMGLMTAEALLLRSNGFNRHDSMYVMLVPCMYFLFCYLLGLHGNGFKKLRTICTAVYIIHPLAIIMIRGFSKLIGMDSMLIGNSFVHYLAVCSLSFFLGALFVLLLGQKQKNTKVTIDVKHSHRAWVEIDLINLIINLNEIKKMIPNKTDIIAVVKANAYGHGDIAIAKELSRFGVKHFAVATVAEGVQLRKSGLNGEILILGYSHPDELRYVYEYDLTQTLIDREYAEAVHSVINISGYSIKVQIKIDTGMNRLGEQYNYFEQILGMYSLSSLKVVGTYTHLSRADSLDRDDLAFTQLQIGRFNEIVGKLKAHGVNPHKLHVQSSYGVFNHPCECYDFVRIGISLYGALSHTGRVAGDPSVLRPVLSLKARIALIKPVSIGEAVGYGNSYTAETDMRIAVVSIGYADGLPRSLSNKQWYVLVGGQKANIIGNICMDQLMIDVSGLEGIQRNDTVTVIGKSGSEVIRAEDVAQSAGTITNELLSRIGDRVYRIIL